MKICIDFDGTCVTHDYPHIGSDIGAAPVLKKIIEAGHDLILFTMRCNTSEYVRGDGKEIGEALPGQYLNSAVDWFRGNNIPLFGVNINPEQRNWTTSPKAYGQLYIDDAALGIPLIHGQHKRPFVDWNKVEKLLVEQGII